MIRRRAASTIAIGLVAQLASSAFARDQQGHGDDVIKDHLVRRLADRADIGKDLRNGAATLAGTVASERDRDRIVRIARQTPGVTSVTSQLQVIQATRERQPGVGDMALSRRVAERIASEVGDAKAGKDWWFEGWRVEGQDNRWSLTVDADNGNVNLEGDVPRARIARKAVEAALEVDGVRSVTSDLDVEPMFGGYGYDGYHPSVDGYPYAYGYPYPYFAYGPDGYDPFESRNGHSPGAASPSMEPEPGPK